MTKSTEPMVMISTFKDADKYRDDLIVGVNGKNYVIQRGKTVAVPRHVAAVLENSMAQDLRVADLIMAAETDYAGAKGKLE